MEVLELGGGFNPQHRPNLDIQKIVGLVDVLGDARKPLPFRNDCLDHVYLAHLIEHMWWRTGENLLREVWRILKEGGKMEVVCPDLEALCRQYQAEGLTDRVSGAFCGGHNNDWDIHYAVYDESTLRTVMTRAGFKIVEVTRVRANRFGIPEIRMVGQK